MMTTLLAKYSNPVLISLLLALFVLAWFFPAAGMSLGVGFLLLSFVIASVAIVHKHRQAYRLGRTSRGKSVRDTVLEIVVTGLTMIAAGLLARALAASWTAQIGNDLVRFAAGIAIGLLTGLGIGFVVSQTWGRLMKSIS
jgi:hypothetical protein